jgi:hypothetical protein
LTYDIKGSILVTNEKISKCRVSQTHQCGDVFIGRGREQRRNHISVNASVRSLRKASIPIHSRCDEIKAPCANPGAEDSLYRKTTQKSGFFSTALRRFHWRLLKQYRYTRLDGISQEKRAWPRDIVKDKFRCFIHMIAWAIVSFPKYIDCWSQKIFEDVVEAN